MGINGIRAWRSMKGPLLAVNFVVNLIILGLSSWSLDKYINGDQNHPHLGGNASTTFLLIFSLLAAVIGVCSVAAGLAHHRAWSGVGLAYAGSLATVSWAVTALALGLVCKQIMLGGHRGKRLQTLEGFIVISVLTQLMYMVALHVGTVDGRFRPTYGGGGGSELGDRFGSQKTDDPSVASI